MCARQVYYVFSKAADEAQFCAVRQDQPIPRFLDGVTWLFVRTLEMPAERPVGFDLDEAEAATRRAGVYFYERVLAFAVRRELEAA